MAADLSDLVYKKQMELSHALLQDARHAASLKPRLKPAPGPTSPPLQLARPDPVANLAVLRHAGTHAVQFLFSDTPQTLSAFPPQPAAASAGTSVARPFALHLANAADWEVLHAWNLERHIANAGSGLLEKLAHEVEQSNKAEGLIDLSAGYSTFVKPDKLASSKGKRVLLFVHGIFSSTESAFSPLGHAGTSCLLNELVRQYDGHVYGYDHWTIAKTPLQNAADLLQKLPQAASWDVDIICHSRGGPVVRALLACPSENKLASANAADRQAWQTIRDQSPGKLGRIGNVVFVGAANQGSPLAQPDEIKNFLNACAVLASQSPCFALDLVIGLARGLVESGFSLPSVEALACDSPFLRLLDTLESRLMPESGYAIRAHTALAPTNAQTASLPQNLGVLLDKLLMPQANDIIVPYDGVLGTVPSIPDQARRTQDFGSAETPQTQVWHTNFFQQAQTQDFLRQVLLS